MSTAFEPPHPIEPDFTKSPNNAARLLSKGAIVANWLGRLGFSFNPFEAIKSETDRRMDILVSSRYPDAPPLDRTRPAVIYGPPGIGTTAKRFRFENDLSELNHAPRDAKGQRSIAPRVIVPYYLPVDVDLAENTASARVAAAIADLRSSIVQCLLISHLELADGHADQGATSIDLAMLIDEHIDRYNSDWRDAYNSEIRYANGVSQIKRMLGFGNLTSHITKPGLTTWTELRSTASAHKAPGTNAHSSVKAEFDALTRLLQVIGSFGFAQTVIMIDGVADFATIRPEHLIELISHFREAESKNSSAVVMQWYLTTEIFEKVSKALYGSGKNLMQYPIRWTEKTLRGLLDKRLRVAMGKPAPEFNIGDFWAEFLSSVCSDPLEHFVDSGLRC
jgi:hypothetical protein